MGLSMTERIHAVAQLRGDPFTDDQLGALNDWLKQLDSGVQPRLGLYHRTGAGKTYTALAAMALAGVQDVLVLAPPSTHASWQQQAQQLKLDIVTISHAKFRQATFKIRRTQAMIIDEVHLLGGASAKGFSKMQRYSRHINAPLIVASATPNYNDAERCYCIQYLLDPANTKGGLLAFIHKHCITTPNHFGTKPIVTGFLKHRDAEHFLSELPKVHYVEDEMIKSITINDIILDHEVPEEFLRLGVDRRRQRMLASQMEERHAYKRLAFMDDDGLIKEDVYEQIAQILGDQPGPSLVYFDSEQLASAFARTCELNGAKALLVTGKLTTTAKQDAIDAFKTGEYDLLIGTATMATGTDGIDKMCDHLLIVDDTSDGSLRRQLMGRILPRGLDSDTSRKVVDRFILA